MSDGLDGVVACQTVLSHNDPETGLVLVRGRPLAELVEQEGYEGTVALMWSGFAGDTFTRDALVELLGAGRQLAFARLDDWLPAAAHRPPIDGLRLCLAAVPADAMAYQILSALPVGIAAMLRARAGAPPVAPDPSLTTAADLLRMVNGGVPVESRY